MVRAIIDPETLPMVGRRWDMVTLGLLAVLFVFSPAAFGAVEAWSEMFDVACAAMLALVLALRTAIDSDFRPAFSWTYVPLALFVALVVVQSLLLPTSIASLLAPNTVSTKFDLLGSPELPAV